MLVFDERPGGAENRQYKSIASEIGAKRKGATIHLDGQGQKVAELRGQRRGP
jgi:hypothetical protein